MSKPIGRLYFNGKCVSGYVIIGNYALKFAAEINDGGKSWIYQSKNQREAELAVLKETLEAKEEIGA